jgi:group I intron endonuclease
VRQKSYLGLEGDPVMASRNPSATTDKQQQNQRSGVYTIVCLVNGKTYVGSSVNVRSRWNAHRRDLRNGQHVNSLLQRSWNRYGEAAFRFNLLRGVPPVYLIQAEQEMIDCLRTADRRFGFNLAPKASSTVGYRFSDDQKAKVSASVKAKYQNDPGYRAKLLTSIKAKCQSPEHRAKMSALVKAKHQNDPEYRAKMSASAKAKCQNDPEYLARRSASAKAKFQSPEHRAKMSATMKAKYQNDPEWKARQAAATALSNRKRAG